MRDRLAAAPREYDLVVVGGGINGAGVARDAARARLPRRARRAARFRFRLQFAHVQARARRCALLGAGRAALGVGSEPRAPALAATRAAPRASAALRLPGVSATRASDRRACAPACCCTICWRHSATCTRTACWPRHAPPTGAKACAATACAAPRGIGMRRWTTRDWCSRTCWMRARRGRKCSTAWRSNGCRIADGRVTGAQVRDLENGGRGGVDRARRRAVRGSVDQRTVGGASRHVRPAVAPTRGTHIVVRPFVTASLHAGRKPRWARVLRAALGRRHAHRHHRCRRHRRPGSRSAPTEAEIAYLLDETNRNFPAAALQRARCARRVRRSAAAAACRRRGIAPQPRARAAGTRARRDRRRRRQVHDLPRGARNRSSTGLERTLGAPGPAARTGCRCRAARSRWPAEEQWNRGPRFAAAAAVLGGARRRGARHRAALARRARHERRATGGMDRSRMPAAPAVASLAARIARRSRARDPRRNGAAAGGLVPAPHPHRFRAGERLEAVEAAAAVFAAEMGWTARACAAENAACRRTLQSIAARRRRGAAARENRGARALRAGGALTSPRPSSRAA